MASFERVSVEQVKGWLSQNAEMQLLDTRDEQSFSQSHIQGALSLSRLGISAVMDSLDKDRPVVVYCYHGISSQQVAAYLAQMDIEQVFSMDGGFEHWRQCGPTVNGHE